MQRNTDVTGDLGQLKSLGYVMDCVPARMHGCEF
jgi:hypothetical protein